MAETITLELTKDEVIMIQELTEDMVCDYQWILDIAENLRTKALQAYQKPKLSRQEYQTRLDNKRKKWLDHPAEEFLVTAERHKLNFFYDVEGADD